MAALVLLSKASPEGVTHVKSLVEMDREFGAQLKKHCPEVKRVAGSTLLGAFDFLHIFEAADAREAAKLAVIANGFALTSTQTFAAIPFYESRRLLEESQPMRGLSLSGKKV